MAKKEKEMNDTAFLVRHFIENFDQTFKGVHILTTTLRNVRNDRIPPTYRDIFESYQALKVKRKWPNNKVMIEKEFIWKNPYLDWDKQNNYDLEGIRAGVLQIRDLWDKDRNTWHTAEHIASKVYHRCGKQKVESVQRKLNNLKGQIPIQIQNILRDTHSPNDPGYITILDIFCIKKSDTKTKNIYCKLLRKENPILEQNRITPMNTLGFYNKDLTEEMTTKFWNMLMKSDVDNKVKEIQWKITNQCIILNDILKQWGLVEDDSCTFCQNSQENLQHILLQCNISKLFWGWIMRNLTIDISLDKRFKT